MIFILRLVIPLKEGQSLLQQLYTPPQVGVNNLEIRAHILDTVAKVLKLQENPPQEYRKNSEENAAEN